jgi:excisionase family DNA binding protein
VLHLFGRESPSYHSHIHVLLFERRGNGIKCRLSPEQLRNLRESYRKALRTLLLRSVPKTVVHHRYASSPAAIRRLIRYVCTPFDPDTIQGKCAALDIYIMDLIIQDLHNFNFWRAWDHLQTTANGNIPEVMSSIESVKELAEYLNLPSKSIYYLVEQATIPYLRLNERMIYVKKEDIDRWIESRRVRPSSEKISEISKSVYNAAEGRTVRIRREVK